MTHHVIKNLKRETRRTKKSFPVKRNSDRNNKRLNEYNPSDGYSQPKFGDLIANQ